MQSLRLMLFFLLSFVAFSGVSGCGLPAFDGSNVFYDTLTFIDWDCCRFSDGVDDSPYGGPPWLVDGSIVFRVECDPNNYTILRETGGFVRAPGVWTPLFFYGLSGSAVNATVKSFGNDGPNCCPGDITWPGPFIQVILSNSTPEAGNSFCTVCRPPQNLRAPCGSALADWLSSGGFVQTEGSCSLRNTSRQTDFCGSQPVQTAYNFTLGTSATYSAVFETTDGSCACDYCYNVQSFDMSYYTAPLPTCWSAEWAFAPFATVPLWNESFRFFSSAPRSAGLDLTGPWTSAGPGSSSSHLISPLFIPFRKTRLTFWLKVVNLNATAGEFAHFAFTRNVLVPASAILKCPYNYNNVGWSGTFDCLVEIDVTFFISTPGSTAQLTWHVTHLNEPLSVTTFAKRVSPLAPTTTYPVKGVWVDDVKFCGANL